MPKMASPSFPGPVVGASCVRHAQTLLRPRIYNVQRLTGAGAAAVVAEANKAAKYASLAVAHEFVPVVIETLGTWGMAGLAFVNEVGRRISSVTGDLRAASFLRQRLSMCSEAMQSPY